MISLIFEGDWDIETNEPLNMYLLKPYNIEMSRF